MTISLCMIVKNEEERLPVCLRSLWGIMDELIIVDTGSTDKTVSVARRLGASVYEYPWEDDFAAARNFAFSMARGDYIYSADADEELTEENRTKLLALKWALADGTLAADIVQFLYCNQLSQDSVYNYDREYRPKLFKRIRPFIWEGAVHEQVRLFPEVYDSDIEIQHRPHGQHADRDLAIFASLASREMQSGETMSTRLLKLYTRELWMAGNDKQLTEAVPYLSARVETEEDGDATQAMLLVLLRAARLRGDDTQVLRYAVRLMDDGPKTAELCCELGEFWLGKEDPGEAMFWFYSAKEVPAVLDLRTQTSLPDDGLIRCREQSGLTEEKA